MIIYIYLYIYIYIYISVSTLKFSKDIALSGILPQVRSIILSCYELKCILSIFKQYDFLLEYLYNNSIFLCNYFPFPLDQNFVRWLCIFDLTCVYLHYLSLLIAWGELFPYPQKNDLQKKIFKHSHFIKYCLSPLKWQGNERPFK